MLCANFTADEEPSQGPGLPTAPAAPRVSPEQAARRAVNNLRLEYPTLGVGPNWNRNMWGFIPVGYPAWFWLEGGSTGSVQTSQTVDGIYVALYAPPPTVVWDFGDGTSQTCGIGTPLGSGVKPGTPSPDCGHAWPRIGDYEVTVTVTWTIRWTAGGQSGQIPITTSTTTTVPVGELQAVNR